MVIENPFSPAFPVNPKYFVNRRSVIDSFKKAIERSTKTKTPTPDNIAILGDWGIGKSSVLRKFENISLKEFKDRKVFSSTIELIPASCNSFTAFTNKFIEDVNSNFTTQTSILEKIKNEIRNWRIKSIGTGIKIERKQKSKVSFFKDALVNLWDILEKSGVDIALLMLDDLHYLSERYPDGLYDLRGIFQNLPKDGCNFMLCLSGKRELFSEVRELAEPLSRFFNIKHTLDVFDKKETADAITKPINYAGLDLTIDDSVVNKIYDLTLGHPYFIHFIMRELVGLRGKGNISLRYFEKNYNNIETVIKREKLVLDFSIASNKEKKILLAMSKLPREFSPSEIKIKNARTHLRFLIKKNLIIRLERGHYKLYHPLFKEYLKSLEKERGAGK